jgi:hypothetical protein
MSEYPTEEELKVIEEWRIEKYEELPAHIASLWNYPEYAKETRPGIWVFATGGWSGNEELIGALKQNIAWNLLAWDSLYVSGGLLVIAIGKEAKEEMGKFHQEITNWAWGVVNE